jgi:hypothetical protein
MIMRPPLISTEADSKVIVPRRNFLIRALGFTAAGASMVLPVVALQSPEERIAHHFKELEAAFRDLYPGGHHNWMAFTEFNDAHPIALIVG